MSWGPKFWLNRNKEHFLIHRIVLEFRKGRYGVTLKGRTKHNQFTIVLARHEGLLEKKSALSAYILTIRGQRQVFTVLVHK